MKKFAGLMISLAALGLVLGGCAKPPAAEMEAAEAALTRAENDAGATAYAESALVRAREAAARMRSEARARRYDAAKTAAAEVIAAAERAVSEGRAGASRAGDEAGSLVDSLRDAYTETEDALSGARNVPNIQLDFPSLSDDLDQARSQIDRAEESVNANQPREALDQGRAARAALGDIQTRISSGVRDAGRKK